MTAQERHNAWASIAGDTLWGLQGGLVASATVFTVLLTRLGADERTIGLMNAIEAGAMVLPQVVGLYLFRTKKNRKVKLILWHAAFVVPFYLASAALLHFGAARLPHGVVRGLLLLSFGLTVTGVGMIVPNWMDWMAGFFGTHIRGRVVGMCLGFASLAGVVANMIAGFLLSKPFLHGRAPLPSDFAPHFLLASVIALVSLAVFMAMRDPDSAAASEPRTRMREVIGHFLHSLREANFRAYLAGRMLAIFGFSILPFISLHYMSGAGGSLRANLVIWCGAAQSLTAAAAMLYFGRLGDRRGHRVGMIVCCVFQVIALAGMLLIDGVAGCLLANAAAGIALGSGGIANYNLLLETCPHQQRIAHVTAGNLVLSTAMIAAPLLSGFVSQSHGTRTLFSICLVFSAASLAWFLFRVREPRDTAALRVA
jgi:MFS family permease